MCIIIHKPAGKQIPSIDTLINCHNNNYHGIGFMINMPTEVVISKGFNSVDKLIAGLNDAEDRYGSLVPRDIAIHFRYATHGEISAHNCHPFPISSDPELLRAINLTHHCAIAHNGIIAITDDDPLLSDTMMFIKDYISEMNFAEIVKAKNLIELAIDTDRLILFGTDNNVLKLGKWIYEEQDGCFYSNGTYRWSMNRRGTTTGNATIREIECDICSSTDNVSQYNDIDGWEMWLCKDCYEANKEFLEDDPYDDPYDDKDDELTIQHADNSPIAIEHTSSHDSLPPLPCWESIEHSQFLLATTKGKCDYCLTHQPANTGFTIQNKRICKNCLSIVYSLRGTTNR